MKGRQQGKGKRTGNRRGKGTGNRRGKGTGKGRDKGTGWGRGKGRVKGRGQVTGKGRGLQWTKRTKAQEQCGSKAGNLFWHNRIRFWDHTCPPKT